jgi:diguanylate cyclase (GGDEF)-like protein
MPAQGGTIGAVQRRFAVSLSSLLILAGVAMTPFANASMPPIPGYMTAFGAAMLSINFMLAMLLYSRGETEGNGSVVMLGTAYFFVATIFVPLMASFPDGLIRGTIIGTPVSSVWLWSFWHAGFGLSILRFAHGAGSNHTLSLSPMREMSFALGIVIFMALVGTLGLPYLPSLFADGHSFFSGPAKLIPWSILAIDALAAVKLYRLPNKTPEHLWLTVGMLAACFDVWLTFHGTDRFSLGWYVSKVGSLATSMAVLVSLFADLTLLYKRSFQTNLLLVTLANQDGMTGLANRRRFDETLDTEWRRARRSLQPLSLMLLDVDLFKKFNDRFGHLAGDDCLRKVATVLRESAQRPGDLAARYGGEEFALVLPNTSAENAMALAALIRRRLAALAIAHPDIASGKVSASIGIATMVPELSSHPESVILAADKALYMAKSEGRDCERHAMDLG